VSSPAKGFPRGALDAARIDAALFEYIFVLGRKIVADYRYHAYFGKEARCQRKVCSRSPENVLDATRGCGDVIERD
jgi:hypothetical protein